MSVEPDSNACLDFRRIRTWVAAAASLEERGADSFTSVRLGKVEEDTRLARWKELAVRGDEVRFGVLLETEDLQRSTFPLFLQDVALRPSSPLPDWASRLPALLALFSNPLSDDELQESELVGNDDIPFSDLFSPYASRLSGTLDLEGFDTSARRDLEQDLVRRLSRIASGCLYGWFKVYRDIHRGSLSFPTSTGSSELYRGFVSWIRNGHILRLFDDYPMLARLFSEVSQRWIEVTAELAGRFREDRDAVFAHFFDGAKPSPVLRAELGAGDTHDNGRTVVVLEFVNKRRVVYKPRDLSADAAWGQLIVWLRDSGAPYTLMAPGVLCRDGYGWSAFVERQECLSSGEFHQFFQRSGALLGLFLFLRSTDFHAENVIASGAFPVPVDLETLLRPRIDVSAPEESSHPALQEVERRLEESVIGAGYLPHWSRYGDQLRVSGALALDTSPAENWRGFVHVNTDAMELGTEVARRTSPDHLPVLKNGMVGRPRNHIEDIVEGFRQTAEFVVRNRAAFAEEVRILFSGTVVRTVLRSTRLYSLVLDRAIQPERLRDGLSFGLEFEFLSRFQNRPTEASRRQVRAERHALERLDIPLFVAGAAQTELREAADGMPISYPGMEAPLSHALQRIADFKQAEIEEQCCLIRTTLEMNWLKVWEMSPWPEIAPTWSTKAATAYAMDIGERISGRAIVREDGASWISAATLGVEERMHFSALQFDFYNGHGGVAIFMAALYRVTGRPIYRDWTFLALAPVLRAIEAEPMALPLTTGMAIGGGDGLGSLIYSLAVVANLIDEPFLASRALDVTGLLTDDRVAKDQTYDIISGASGAILSLLALYRYLMRIPNLQGAAVSADRAKSCAEHLLAHPFLKEDRHAEPDTVLAGLSHGAAGFAMALLALNEIFPDQRYTEAASTFLAYENGLYVPEERNWRDLRFIGDEYEKTDEFPCNWCHGAAGIALGRMSVARSGFRTPRIDDDIEIAIATTIAAPMGMRDAVCCGNFGRISSLFEAGLMQNRADWVELARRRAAIRMEKAPDRFLWLVGDDSVNHGFFQGLSGIGYEVLRLAYPEYLPCVLTWQLDANG